MAAVKWANDLVLDGGLTFMKNNITKMVLIGAQPAVPPVYATVYATKLAEVALITSDLTIGGGGGLAARTLTVAAGKSSTATANSTASPELHLMFVDNSNNILWITDETSNQTIYSGNTINFPAPVYTSNLPV